MNTIDTPTSITTKEKIDQSVTLITSAIQDLRNLSLSMNAELVRNNGLIKTLEEEVGRINRIKGTLQLKYKILGESTFMDTQRELLLFRIIQECINNVIKHSGATDTEIRLHYGKENLAMQISDNGKGFDVDHVPKTNGSGLYNIKARTSILKGNCSIESSERGTTLYFNIPYS